MQLYYHPISIYCHKVMIAVEEKGVSYEGRVVELFNPDAMATFRKINPMGKVPYMVRADGVGMAESSNIVEYLDQKFIRAGIRLIPDDAETARHIRYLDRLSDLYLTPGVAKLLFQKIKPAGQQDQKVIADGQKTLNTVYAQLEDMLRDHTWLAGDHFSMADCAAASPLFYAHIISPFGDYPKLAAYYQRLMARPSVHKVMDSAVPAIRQLGLDF